jgi:hypothetical protein
MKIKTLLMALLLMPFFGFSQQIEEKNTTLKKENSEKVIRKVDLNQIQIEQTGSQKMIKPCSENERTMYSIPDDFPRIINTGNQRKDEDDYYKAQEVWIKNNPERFKKIKNTSL